MREYTRVVVSLLAAIIMVTSSCQMAAASVVWSDNFDDHDMEGWETYGCDASDGCMHWTGETNLAVAFHNSTVKAGTWSFDLIENEQGAPTALTRVRFITHVNRENFQPWNAIYLQLSRVSTDTGYRPKYVLHKNFDSEGPIQLASFEGPESGLTTHHIRISREFYTGQIHVYVNGTRIMQVLGGEPTDDPDPGNTVFHFASDRDVALDNVEVDDTSDPYVTPTPSTSPTTTTTATTETIPVELLLAGGVIIVAVILIAVFAIRRRG